MTALLISLPVFVLDDPAVLAVALLVPIAIWLRRRGGERTLAFAPAHVALRTPLPSTWRTRLASIPRWLEVAAALIAVVALARPMQATPLPREREGIDVVLCIDVSSSMTARDLDGVRTRLEVVKEAATKFVAARPDDRIGLITFARYPDVACPRTLDHRALAQAIATVALVEADGPEDATGVGAAVARAAAMLSTAPQRTKVVILLTDGEENVATGDAPNEIAPLHAAQLCEVLGARVYAIAAGLGRYAPTRAGPSVFEPIDTRPIEELAQRSGGRFFSARDASALADVYAEIDRLETSVLREPRTLLEDRCIGFIAAALALYVLARALRVTVFAEQP